MTIPPHMVMILACSKDKNVGPGETCAARDMYAGQIFKKGRSIAEKHGIPFFILSAKYGFLKPDTMIEWYEARFTQQSPYKGTFPPEPWHGFYVGGEPYFKRAPRRFERLIDKLPIGMMLKELTTLQHSDNIVKWKIDAHLKHYPD